METLHRFFFRLLLPLVLGLNVVSCQQRPGSPLLLSADSLTMVHPDSALQLLQLWADTFATAPEADRMHYRLLCVKAADKAYIEHTSDSVILPILRYYQGKGDKRLLPEACYYAGRVYRDLHDAPQALEYFQQAEERLEKEKNPDHLLQSKVCSQSGTLFLYQGVYEEAMKAYRKAYKYAKLAKNHRGMIFALRDIGETFMGFGNGDSAAHYYREACQLSEEGNDQYMQGIVIENFIDLYLQTEEYDSVKACLQYLNEQPNGICRELPEIVYADWFYQIGELDSAAYYYNLSIENSNIYGKQHANWRLAQLAQGKGDCSSVIEHINQYQDLSDSISKITNREEIRKMQSLYNYQLREKENKRLEEENVQQKIWNILISTVFVVSISFGMIYVRWIEWCKHQVEKNLKTISLLRAEEQEASARRIEDNEQRIKELEKRLQDASRKANAIRYLLENQKRQATIDKAKVEMEMSEKELATLQFKQSDICHKFHNAQDSKEIQKEDWQALEKTINDAYIKFTQRLQALYPVSELEKQICLLIKTGISVSKIATLTDHSKSAIVSARKRLYEKISGEKGTPGMLDALVHSL